MMKKRTDEEIDAEMGQAIAEGKELKGWTPVKAKLAKNPRVVFGVRLSEEEARLFTDAANARGITLSEFIRAAAFAAATGESDVDQAARLAALREKVRELSELVAAS